MVQIANTLLERMNGKHGTQRRFAPALLDSLLLHAWPGNVLGISLKTLYNRLEEYASKGELPEWLRANGAGAAQNGTTAPN